MNGIKTNSQSGNPTKSEELLSEILSKLTHLTSRFDLMSNNLHEVTNTIKIQSDLLKNILEKTTNETEKPFLPRKEPNDTQTELETQKQKIMISNPWSRFLNERKHAYWNSIRCNNIANTYQKWRSKQNPILPTKFLIREIEGEKPRGNKNTSKSRPLPPRHRNFPPALAMKRN